MKSLFKNSGVRSLALTSLGIGSLVFTLACGGSSSSGASDSGNGPGNTPTDGGGGGGGGNNPGNPNQEQAQKFFDLIRSTNVNFTLAINKYAKEDQATNPTGVDPRLANMWSYVVNAPCTVSKDQGESADKREGFAWIKLDGASCPLGFGQEQSYQNRSNSAIISYTIWESIDYSSRDSKLAAMNDVTTIEQNQETVTEGVPGDAERNGKITGYIQSTANGKVIVDGTESLVVKGDIGTGKDNILFRFPAGFTIDLETRTQIKFDTSGGDNHQVTVSQFINGRQLTQDEIKYMNDVLGNSAQARALIMSPFAR